MPEKDSLNFPDEITVDSLREYYDSDEFLEEYGGKSAFQDLFTPKTRALIMDAFLNARTEPQPARYFADYHDDLSVSSFNRHREVLLDYGVIVETGKVGNAMTYSLNINHPAVQVLAMLDNIFVWRETPILLENEFVVVDDDS